MYNSGLFSDRQESTMPAKKAPSGRKSTVGKKRKVTRKKPASKKKALSRKKPAAKKAGKKKVIKKKSAGKKRPSRKAAPKKKVSGKKVSRKKTVKKKPTKKSASKKKAAKKKPSTKKVAKKVAKKAAKKPAKKAPSKKKTTVNRAPPRKTPARRTIVTKSRAPRGDILSAPIHGIEPYNVTRGEEYMSQGQLNHFNRILTSWKDELMNEVDRTVHHMQDEAANFPDPNDRATQESEFGLELRTRDRERKLLRKITSAIARIDEQTYGYCDETGEEIGLKRLEARPVATLCLEAQERRELAERQFRDRDDRYR